MGARYYENNTESKLNSDTLEDWRYVVNPLGDSGNAKIEVIDENGEFVSYL